MYVFHQVVIQGQHAGSEVVFANEKLATLHQLAYENVYIEIFTLPSAISSKDAVEALNAVSVNM